MKNEKYVFFSLIILIGLISISFASADANIILDENTQSNIEELSLDSSNENLILDENNDNTFIDSSDENLILDEKDDSAFIDTNEKTKLSDPNTYSFTKLNETINSENTVIDLTDNYKYMAGDEAFVNGIIINRSITINGNGITIDGSNTARIFNITGNDVTINNITFINGRADGNTDSDRRGGAILWNGANGTLSNSTFNNNTATDYGGAILWWDENGTISNSIFNNNNAKFGGAIYRYGKNGTISNSTFNNNTATQTGGAILWLDENGTISNSTFNNNTAGSYGGAIRWFAENGTISNSTFNNNTATNGGGAFIWDGANSNISNSTFNNNTAGSYGGAILWNDMNGTISNSTFNNNNATNGGAILWWGENGTISNSTFNNNNATNGGAIRWDGKNGTISNSTFNNNTAGSYGGAIRWFAENGTISNSTFNNNNATNGGAIRWEGTNGTIINSTFNNNNAKIGGAIYWYSRYSNVSSCLFINNTATDNGSAYYNNNNLNSFSTFNNNILLNNSPNEIYFKVFGSSNTDYNWFGNNASNYDQKPYEQSNTWLFINGTADPNIITLPAISEITFKLYSYDGNEIADYDNSILYPINLSLSTTKGTLSKDTARLSEDVTFQTDSSGNATVSAKVENVQTDITITIKDGGNFWDLNRTINANNDTEITLDKNYTYNRNTDSAFVEGIIINRTVTINGNNITIDGLELVRIFKIIGNNVTINNITFINGAADGHINPDKKGGAILWEGANGTVSNSTFNNNYGLAYGGAIYWRGENGAVSNSTFYSNAGSYGGAIYWRGENGAVSNSTFNYNRVLDDGGAILWDGENGTISNSTFNNNKASRNGGAIYWDDEHAEKGTISNSTFNNNIATDYGGAIYWMVDNSAISNSTFNNNTANYGGAIQWNGENGTLSNSTFNNNTAKLGGAIRWNMPNGILSNSTFNNNTATQTGGAIQWYGRNGTLSNSTFNNNTAEYYGGAIHWYNINGTISNSTFNNNNATYGAAIFWDGENGTLSNSTFNNNTATQTGGAIQWNGRNGTLSNSTFNNNKANTDGGAILWNGTYGTINNSTFNNNTAEGEGGSIFWNSENGTVSNSTFNNNKAKEGGAILWEGENGIVSNSTFNDNTASNYGGAITWKGMNGIVSKSAFINNNANYGGAINWYAQYGNVSNCLFVNNTAATEGNVYYNDYNRNTYSNFTNNIVLNNGEDDIYFKIFEGSNADYNWFGNNASTYDEKPCSYSNIWLFINGTIDPEIPVLSTSNIRFNLYAYNSATGEISEFNDQIYPITLSLSSTNGNLSKNTAGLGEEISYTSEGYGIGSVTASIENAKSTITIETIPEYAELKVSIGDNEIDYGENATIILEFNQMATGTVNITLTGKKHEINITDEELKETILISGLNPDEYTITVSYSGDNTFTPETKTASTNLTVNKANPTVNVQNSTTEWNVPVTIPVSVEGAEGYPATGMVIVTVDWIEDSISKVFNLEDGIESVTFKIDETVGECTIIVKYFGDENYNAVNATAKLTITESTELNVEVTDNSPIEGQDLIITVTATDGRGTEVPITKVNLTIDGEGPTEIELDEKGNANLGNLAEGPHTITISINDGVHQEKTVTKEIVVNPCEITPTEIVVTVENISYGAKPVIEFTFKDIAGKPLSGTLNVTVADKQYPVTVNDDGKGTLIIQDILPADTYQVVANFAGNQTHKEATGTAYFSIAKNATMIIFENMQTKAVDPKADGRIGEWFYFTLKDVNGNPIANTPMEIGFNGVVYTYEKDGICTDENGVAKLQINLGYKGDYTFAICYLGNQSYNASFVVAKITVNCQTPTLTVPNKSYAASAKTKTLTATFKNEHGKLIADKQISFTVNGKTYKAKTNSKGVASVNVSLNKKGTYTVVAKYAGASTYNAVSKKAKLTIK